MIRCKRIPWRQFYRAYAEATVPKVRLPSISSNLESGLFAPALDVSPFVSAPHAVKTPVDQRILVSIFLQAVLRNDFNRSRSTLGKIALKISDIEQARSYYSCLQLLLNSFTPESANVYNIQALYTDFNAVEKRTSPYNLHEIERQIQVSLIISFIHCYSNIEGNTVGSKVVRNSIVKFIDNLIAKSGTDISIISSKLGDRHLSSLKHVLKKSTLKKLTFDNVPISEQRIDDQDLSIDPFTDKEGFVNLERLCKYISSTGSTNKDSGPMKMYTHYDSLTQEQQSSFDTHYNAINEKRQLVVENNMLSLMESLVAPTKGSGFKSADKATMYSWYSDSLKVYTALLKRLNNLQGKSDLNPEDTIYAKNLAQLNSVPSNTLVTLVLATLVSQTMSSPDGYVTVVSLSQSLLFSFKRLIGRDQYLKSISDNLLQISNEEGIQLFGSLLKIFIDACKFAVPDHNMVSFAQSLSLTQSSIDPGFISSNSAFLHSVNFKKKTGKRLGVIKIHPYLFHQFKTDVSLAFDRSLYLPMLHKPKPWTSPHEGGYLSLQRNLLASQDISSSLRYIEEAHKTGQLDSTYHGLNVLGSQAWAINSNVNQVFNDVMKLGSGFLKIPPKLENLAGKAMSPTAADTQYHDLKNVRIVIEMTKEIANAFDANGDAFYLPHSLDFRGRAYPCVSVLSHHQDDLVRGLIMFWHSKPLGHDGFNWLVYQLVGVFGKDKLPLEERLTFFEHCKSDIIDSARNPLHGNKWWMMGEKPWQTLALCFDIEGALDFVERGGSIEDYRSRSPVHQDGSCNGLQHYAALGADVKGATAVNLAANETKQDAYSTVLQVVHSKISSQDKPQTEGTQLALRLLSRKIIKQTVMTTVYGVTRYGGAEQISHRIGEIIQDLELKKQRGELIDSEFHEQLVKHRAKMSMYISGLVLDSLSQLFEGATLLQHWLSENCARIVDSVDLETIAHLRSVSKEYGPVNLFNGLTFRPMQWTTVAGFPVVQMYKRRKLARLPSALQNIAVTRPQIIAPVDRRKQSNAVAPNFIHSIDSLHMFMTAVAVNTYGHSFAAVHDSYWTHAANVDQMSKVLRQEFVRLYDTNIIEELRKDLVYLTRNSFQILWIHKRENYALYNEVEKLRPNKRTKRNLLEYSDILVEEMTNNTEVTQLLQKYKPSRYMRHGKRLVPYGDPNGPQKLFKLADYFPVLVPVEILESPKRGDFNIHEVLHSKYFFS